MDLIHAMTLAAMQGLTEFLPVSSSAHLILFSHLFGWADQGVVFDITVHLGTLSAVVFHYRKALLDRSAARPFPAQRHPLLLVGVASVPTFIAAYWFEPFITGPWRGPMVIAGATVFFALLLGLADYRRKKNAAATTVITLPYAVLIGSAQALALIPGTSRAGITMTACLLLGLSRTHATHFSFLLAIPVIAGAGFYAGLQLVAAPDVDVQVLMLLLISFVLAAVIALATIRLFLALVEKIGMLPFVVYRVVLGVILMFLFE